MKNGYFVISLDFEIYWGVRDIVSIEGYKENLLGVRRAIPAMLELFRKYNINATFATVGLLFFENKNEMLAGLPYKIPKYVNKDLSPYEGHFDTVGNNETVDPFHFAPSLIQMVKDQGQEMGCHTFSHYYCLEEGQTIEDFKEDLDAARRVAAKKGITMKSFVFPRNQYNEAYLDICKQQGITSFRGNEDSVLFSAKNFGKNTKFRRPFRLMDAYINLSGNNCYDEKKMLASDPVNIPASRFLRPWSSKLAAFDGLRLKRIKNSMTYAAKNNLMYHLWWHPHNFGANTEKNISFLEKILQHYVKLSDQYNYASASMEQLTEILKKENG